MRRYTSLTSSWNTRGQTSNVVPQLIDHTDNGKEQKPGTYLVDTRTSAFNITIPNRAGEWEFLAPHISIKQNVLTINAGSVQNFSDDEGVLQQDDLEVNTHLTIVRVVNIDGSNNFYVTVADSRYEDENDADSIKVGDEVNNTTTATKGEMLLVDVRTDSVTVVPPANPKQNDIFGVVDAYSNAQQNNITIDFIQAAQLLHSKSEQVILNVDTARMTFIYANDTIGWILT